MNINVDFSASGLAAWGIFVLLLTAVGLVSVLVDEILTSMGHPKLFCTALGYVAILACIAIAIGRDDLILNRK